LYITVPSGRATDIGWQRMCDVAGLDELVDAFGPVEEAREFYRYDLEGWHRSDASEARDAVYRDHFADPSPDLDRAVAARAIACLTLKA
jgi:hypothetical protein